MAQAAAAGKPATDGPLSFARSALPLAGEVEGHADAGTDRDPDANAHRDIADRRPQCSTQRHAYADASADGISRLHEQEMDRRAPPSTRME